jgi:hypothetical protein
LVRGLQFLQSFSFPFLSLALHLLGDRRSAASCRPGLSIIRPARDVRLAAGSPTAVPLSLHSRQCEPAFDLDQKQIMRQGHNNARGYQTIGSSVSKSLWLAR